MTTVTLPKPRALPTSPGENGWIVTRTWHGSSVTCAWRAGGEVTPDLPRLFDVLNRHRVTYILIGGLAAIFHGSPFPTEDADITPKASRANLTCLAAALNELNARIRTESVPEGLSFTCTAEGLAAAQTWNLVTDAGDLDISFQPSGTRGYADLHRDAISADIYDVIVQIAALSDIIRSKQAANRPKDQRVLPTLREILANRDG